MDCVDFCGRLGPWTLPSTTQRLHNLKTLALLAFRGFSSPPHSFAPSLEPSLGCFWDWLSGDEAVCSPRRKCHCSFLSAPNLSQPPRPRPHLSPRPGPLNLHFDLHSFFSSITPGPIDSKAQRPPLLVGCFITCIACFVACPSSVVCGGWEAPSMP